MGKIVQMANEDVAWVVANLPKDVKRELMAIGPGACVAGGFIRSCIAREKMSDIDLFCRSTVQIEQLVNSLGRGRTLTTTENAHTLISDGIPIQVITRWVYPEPEGVLENFDFSIAQSVVWYEQGSNGTWRGFCSQDFYHDLAACRVNMSPRRTFLDFSRWRETKGWRRRESDLQVRRRPARRAG